MTYKLLLSEDAREYVVSLDQKNERIVRDNLSTLADDPYPRPGAGAGDRERLHADGEELYRLHIGRTHTAFYLILEEREEVRVVEIMPIDEAHDRYGF